MIVNATTVDSQFEATRVPYDRFKNCFLLVAVILTFSIISFIVFYVIHKLKIADARDFHSKVCKQFYSYRKTIELADGTQVKGSRLPGCYKCHEAGKFDLDDDKTEYQNDREIQYDGVSVSKIKLN